MTLGAERSQLLVRATRLLIAAGVLTAGLAAAWPFRQELRPPSPATPAPRPLELVVRREEAALAVSPPSDQSPAAALEALPGRQPSKAEKFALGQLTETSLRLEQFPPPPQLPVAFHSESLPVTPSANGAGFVSPKAEESRSAKQRRERIHYVRDGDSLESLAQRFLGSRERAAEIYEVNRGTLSRPDLLPVGTKIVIPPRDSDPATLTGPAAQPP